MTDVIKALKASLSRFESSIEASEKRHNNDFNRMTTELLEIANNVPEGMPSIRNLEIATLSKGSALQSDLICSTVGFVEFPLAARAAEVVDGVPDFWRSQALEFAHDTAEVARFVARFHWDGSAEPEPWSYKFSETYETRIEPRRESGRIFIRMNPFYELYLKLKWWLSEIEATRLRECPVCKRLYYAARRDQPACTTGCGHRLRSRRWYETRGKKRERREARRA